MNAFKSLLTPTLLGILGYLVVIGPLPLDPTNIAWIRNGDSIYPYLGWAFFRNTSWLNPIGLNPSYGLDISSSIVYSDSIPLLAIFFKIFHSFLPSNFQYLGLWLLICFILQSVASWKLISLFEKNKIILTLTSFLFIFTPCLLWRVYVPELGLQTAIVSHFFILFSIYLILNKKFHDLNFYWTALLATSILINFYMFIMVFLLWCANIGDLLLSRKVKQKNALFYIGFNLALIALVGWQLGYFEVKTSSLSTNEYGACGMNLLSIISPPNNDWSIILKTIPGTGLCYEDSNYLGVGVIILLLVALLIGSKFRKQITLFPRHHIALITLCVFLTLFSLANPISIGSFRVAFSPPEPLIFIGGVLRQAGRLFWPVLYLLEIFSIYIICVCLSKKKAIATFICILLIQIIDTSPAWIFIHQKFAEDSKKSTIFQIFTTSLINPFWNEAGARYVNLIQMPVTQNPDGGNAQNRNLSYALEHKMGTNAAFQARIDSNKLKNARDKEANELMSGKYSPTSLYILSEEKLIPALMHFNHKDDVLAKIDGVNIIAPGWRNCQNCAPIPEGNIIRDRILLTNKETALNFSSIGNARQYLIGVGFWPQVGWGWSFPEAFGVWSEGYQTKLVIPLPVDPVAGIDLTMRALVTSSHPTQEIGIWVNGQFQKKVFLSHDDGNTVFIAIPKTMPEQDFVTIELRLPNKVKPKDLGIGDDMRELAIGLIRGVWR